MSEKRFTLFGLDNETIKDDVTKECYWVNEYVQRKKLVDLLNEQQATINHLKQELGEYKENWDDMVKLATKTSLRNVELDEQIGQLRKELNDCEKFRYTVFKRMGELNDE